MLKQTYSDVLGLGGQSMGDFLSTADDSTVRSKYYDALDSGLNASSEPAELDDNRMLIQGILPTLAVALLTKGKALGFAGPAIQNVVEGEQKRVDKAQQLSVEAKLKGAGILGEDLQKREAIMAARENKRESLEQQKELAKQASEDRRYAAELSSSDRRYAAGLAAQNRSADDTARDSKRQLDAIFKIQGDFRSEANRLGLQKASSAIADVKSLLSGPMNAQVQGQLGTKAVKLAGDVGNIGLKERAQTLQPTLQSKVMPWVNFITNGNEAHLADATVDGFKVLVKLYEDGLSDKVNSLRAEFRGAFGDAPPIDKNHFEQIINNLGSSYVGGKGPVSSGPSSGAKFKAPNGAVKTLAEWQQLPDWNDSLLDKMTPVE